MKKHFDVLIKGKVQGVGFRYEAKEFADKLGVNGYARNMRDGTVKMEIEGEQDKINEFISWCLSGISLAKVGSLEKVESDVKHYREFQIY